MSREIKERDVSFAVVNDNTGQVIGRLETSTAHIMAVEEGPEYWSVMITGVAMLPTTVEDGTKLARALQELYLESLGVKVENGPSDA